MEKIFCLLHSRENAGHTHEQEPVECELLEGGISGTQAVVITPDGVKCTAIFNPWLGWMADDKYGTVK